ncbi:MAG: hypothetical protein AABY22_09685 [Nanoarchaeota archaeon]
MKTKEEIQRKRKNQAQVKYTKTPRGRLLKKFQNRRWRAKHKKYVSIYNKRWRNLHPDYMKI